MGSPARRTPRSKTRATSLWLANRIFPRLAYRTTRCCTAGNWAAGSATLPPAHYGKQAPPVEPLPGRTHLDLGTHSGADPAFITRSPAAIFHLGRALRGDGVLPVLPEPVAVKARIQVIPGEHLTVITFARSVPCEVHGLVGQRRRGAAVPPLEREMLAPPVEPRAVPPRGLDDLAYPAVTPGQQAFDDAGLAVVVPEADGLGVAAVGAQRAAQLAQPLVDHLRRALGGPLERRVRLGHEGADRHRAADVAPAGRLPPRGDDPAGQLGDGQHVLVGLGGRPAHEVQLHLPDRKSTR